MNWYGRILRFSQIWETGHHEGFEDELESVYELEYKRQALMNNEFTGLPQRKENILEKIEEELLLSLENVRIDNANLTKLPIFNNTIQSVILLENQIQGDIK